MWILLAFGSALFAGATAILANTEIKKIDFMLVIAIRTIIILIFSWLMVFIGGSFDTILTIDSKAYVFLILYTFALLSVVLTIVNFTLTNTILQKRLNLE